MQDLDPIKIRVQVDRLCNEAEEDFQNAMSYIRNACFQCDDREQIILKAKRMCDKAVSKLSYAAKRTRRAAPLRYT